MPRRTNDFQTLIALIEQQFADGVSRVTQSVMLADRVTGESREVDVVIESRVNGRPVVVSIECRDHRRRAHQAWIDELVGKHRNLPTNKLIAVASAGFTKGAVVAARLAGIDALSIEQATAANWRLIADLPEEMLTVAHAPYAEQIVMVLAKGEALPAPIDLKGARLHLG